MAGETQLQPVTMYGVRIIFRNLKGEESKFNRPGVRNFGVILPDDLAEAMLRDGWNVKYLKASEEEEAEGIERGPAWLPVEAAFDKGRPPKIILVNSTGTVRLDEDTVKQLDDVDIAIDPDTDLPKCDLIVRPYNWSNPKGETGIKAYLKSMYVTIEEDELDLKYSELRQQ